MADNEERNSQGFSKAPASTNDSSPTQGLEEQARHAAEQARTMAERSKQKLVERAEGVSAALRHASSGLRSDEQAELASYTTRVADKLEQLTATLRDRDVAAMVTDVTRFAKRQPALFLGGAFSAGLLAARFLKSSSQAASGSPGNESEAGGRTSDNARREPTVEDGFGPAPGGYGPASAPAGAHGGAGIFGTEGAGGGPGNDPGPVRGQKGDAE